MRKKIIMPLDEGGVSLLKKKPARVFGLKERTLKEVIEAFKETVSEKDRNRNLLIHMSIKSKSANTVKQIGWKISSLMSKDSLVIWHACTDNKNFFEFRFYDKPNTRLREMPFIDQIKHFEGFKVKKITNIKINEQERVAIIFNNRYGSALFFTKQGKFEGIGVTTKYGA